jgi:hypothetical protein
LNYNIDNYKYISLRFRNFWSSWTYIIVFAIT